MHMRASEQRAFGSRGAALRLILPVALVLSAPLVLSPCFAHDSLETDLPAVASQGDSMPEHQSDRQRSGDVSASSRASDDSAARYPRAKEREKMVREQIESRGVEDPAVLAAMRSVPRHEFVPESSRGAAYQDRPLPIGLGQTISQPYIVAVMSELAGIEKGSKVLEIGTGSGYQAAVIDEIAGEVYSIEIVGELAKSASETLERLGYDKAHIRHGNGYEGWPEQAPFDAILVTAAPPEVPSALLEQLAINGRLVVPVGEHFQQLEVHTRTKDGIRRESVFAVRFVPMVERARYGTGPED